MVLFTHPGDFQNTARRAFHHHSRLISHTQEREFLTRVKDSHPSPIHGAIMHASAIKTCQTSCPRAVFTAELSAKLEATVAASGWPDFLLKRYAASRRHHHFRIAAASCALHRR